MSYGKRVSIRLSHDTEIGLRRFAAERHMSVTYCLRYLLEMAGHGSPKREGEDDYKIKAMPHAHLEEAMTYSTTVMIPESLLGEIDAAAKHDCRSRSEFLRVFIAIAVAP